MTPLVHVSDLLHGDQIICWTRGSAGVMLYTQRNIEAFERSCVTLGTPRTMWDFVHFKKSILMIVSITAKESVDKRENEEIVSLVYCVYVVGTGLCYSSEFSEYEVINR